MAIEAVFFDMDETLIATRVATNAAYQYIKEVLRNKAPCSLMSTLQAHADQLFEKYEHGLQSVENEMYKLKSPKDIRVKLWESAISSVLNENNVQSSLEERLKIAEELYMIWNEVRLENLKMIEPTNFDTLSELRKNYKLLLLTNGSSVVQWEKIKALNFEEYFDYIIVSGDELHDKPHQSIFKKACTLCDCLPDKCAMVGDTIVTDIEGANNAKLAMSIYFARNEIDGKFSDESSQCKPSHSIKSLSELLEILYSFSTCENK